ncbi:unnamed protein product [Microthlaspi erraticum]|uniref:F-box domain-containing protein n=1 Tax=Microthlaspi erraticum TaxID=1685480 RepID=A0A6D2HRJ0_9BRAS|nr:unnamed protein product [Microthlaspi erraticum]
MEKLKQKKKKVSYSYEIPYDLLLDIFSRVPAKSIARFSCLSKSWRSKLGLPYFTELFLTKSLARPRLLFAIKDNEDLFFFSSPQPQNPVDKSSLVATRYRMNFPKYLPSRVCPPHSGLVFLHSRGRKERVICNPVTGESITLPKVYARGVKRCFLGYDPINKQFKVLCTTRSRYEGRSETYWVLTLETGKLIWRRTMECIPHTDGYGEICINGVLYYKAHIDGSSCVIVCFDFSSEKFSFIKLHGKMLHGTLINYKEDAGKRKWCKRISVLLSLHDKLGINLDKVGMTGAGEIVFVPPYRKPDLFYIVYYNIERKTFARVNIDIHGSEELKDRTFVVTTFLDYVENMKFL